MMKLMQATILALLVGTWSPAGAHGDAAHATVHRHDAAKVEETAFGQEGDPRRITRTISIDMLDTMRFRPDKVEVRLGQTVRFVVRNRGHVLHEMVLGTDEELQEHVALMKRFPNMEHADPNMAHVKPGASGQIVWQFSKPGEFRFACLQPGHYEAGMLGKVIVK